MIIESIWTTFQHPTDFLIVFAGLVATVFSITLIIRKTGVKVNIKKGKGVTINDTKEEPSEPPFSILPDKNDFSYLIVLTIRIYKLLTFDAIQAQMNFADDKIAEIRRMAEVNFLSFLSTRGIKAWSPEHQHYRNVLKIMGVELSNLIRALFHENGIENFSEMEFQTYVETKSQQLLDTAISYTDEVWVNGQNIEREDVKQWNNTYTYPKAKDIIEGIIKHGRFVGIEIEDKIEKLMKEYKERTGQEFPREALDL